jgi:hypothetical protein
VLEETILILTLMREKIRTGYFPDSFFINPGNGAGRSSFPCYNPTVRNDAGLPAAGISESQRLALRNKQHRFAPRLGVYPPVNFLTETNPLQSG